MAFSTFNPRAAGGGGGGWIPVRFFLNFSKANYYPDLRLSVALGISLRTF